MSSKDLIVYAKTNGRCWYCGKALNLEKVKKALRRIKNYRIFDDGSHAYSTTLDDPI